MEPIIILFSVALTSLISGFLGMGGGMILMAVLSLLLDIQEAMIIHGFTQFFANGFRAYLNRKYIRTEILLPYILFSLATLALLRGMSFSPNKANAQLCLGLFPFIALLPRIADYFSIQKKGRASICGVLVSSAQVSAGASGGVLDMFYITSSLNRFEILSNKAVTQTLGHLLKLIYFISFIQLSSFQQELKVPLWVYPLIVFFSFIATASGKRILAHFKEAQFRKYNKILILMIAGMITLRGLRLKGLI